MSSVDPFRWYGGQVDSGDRIQFSNTVSASPTGSAETVVASTPAFPANVPFSKGVQVSCELAYTIGTSGVSCQVRIRTGVTAGAGTVLYDSGAQTGGHNTATQLVSDSAAYFHTTPVAGQQYCVTLTIASGAATSTVTKVNITAIAY